MPSPPHLKTQIQNVTARVGALFHQVLEKAAGLRVRILAATDRLLDRVPQEKRRLVVMGAAGFLAAVLLVIIGVSLATRDGPGERRVAATADQQSQPQRAAIPSDELFLPFEPDFVPGVILGREQREEWTVEDAAPLWQNPLKNGEQEWRDLIEKTVDTIMESVP